MVAKEKTGNKTDKTVSANEINKESKPADKKTTQKTKKPKKEPPKHLYIAAKTGISLRIDRTSVRKT